MSGAKSRWPWLYGGRVCRVLQRRTDGMTRIEFEEGGTDWVDFKSLDVRPGCGKQKRRLSAQANSNSVRSDIQA